MKKNLMFHLVDKEGNTIDYLCIGLMQDYSNTDECPRIKGESEIMFDIESNPDPLALPGPDITTEKNPFKRYPCSSCLKHTRKGKFNIGKGSKNEYVCHEYNGKVVEIGFYKGTPPADPFQNL